MEVIVIGGGASGLMAAITAAQSGHSVYLYERQQRVGKKLLATGNGRCNLTNTGAGPENYHGQDPDFAKYALLKFTPAQTIAWFKELGLLTVEEYGGRVYPLSDSANSVVDVLRFAAEAAGVVIAGADPVKSIRRTNGGFTVASEGGIRRADRVIVACGGCAGGKLGGVRDGYELLSSLGHSRTKLFPALTRLTTESDYPRALKGVRAAARLRLVSGRELLAQSEGELQFTENGISGPASFDISRAAAVCQSPMEVKICFFTGYENNEIVNLLLQRQKKLPQLSCDELLTGLLHNRLGKMIVKYSGIEKPESIAELSCADIKRVVDSAFHFVLKVKGTDSFDGAQVTAGGIKTSEFDPKTMESRKVPGLFACGEVLDIDADCGGFNLQWAWASGRLAGRLGR